AGRADSVGARGAEALAPRPGASPRPRGTGTGPAPGAAPVRGPPAPAAGRARLCSRAVNRPVEREFKLRIPSAAAERELLARLGGTRAAPARQVNHFFDTAERTLRRARIALRLREEQGVFTLALKGPALA